MEKAINKVITALIKLEATGCHRIFFEYRDGIFEMRIFRSETVLYERTVNLKEEQEQLDEMFDFIENLKFHIEDTIFQCYKREYVKGEKSGEWEKTGSTFECGDNATTSMLIDGSGYYIDDPDNGLQYFVDMNRLSETMEKIKRI